jgi:hypothetical protein
VNTAINKPLLLNFDSLYHLERLMRRGFQMKRNYLAIMTALTGQAGLAGSAEGIREIFSLR